MTDERIQEGMSDAPAPLSASDGSSDDTQVTCPRCFRPTDSLKAYNIGKVLFLLYFIKFDYESVIACPSCMRQAIAKRTLVSLLLTNVFFPIVAIIYLCQYLATLSAGHSDLQIAYEHRRGPDERFGDVERAITVWTWPHMKPIMAPIIRVFLGVVIGVILIVVVVLIIGAINHYFGPL
jgi:hypothetical protein